MLAPSDVWTLRSPGDRARRDVGSTASGKSESSHLSGCRIQKRLMLRPRSMASSLKSETKDDLPASKSKWQNPSQISLKYSYCKKIRDLLLTSKLNWAKLLYYQKSELVFMGRHILINVTIKWIPLTLQKITGNYKTAIHTHRFLNLHWFFQRNWWGLFANGQKWCIL